MRILFISRPTIFSVPGGDSIQMLQTKKYLEKVYGIHVDIYEEEKDLDLSSYDIFHFFNLIRPNNILPFLKYAKANVISPIYVDYSEYDRLVRGGLASKISALFGKGGGSEYLKAIMRWVKNGEYPGSMAFIFSGYRRSIINILDSANYLLPNSESEYQRISSDFPNAIPYRVVPNAVDSELLKTTHEEKRSGVICVARIEGLKNQLNLIKAIKLTDLKLKIIGKASPNHQAYYELCRAEANEQIEFIEHLKQEELQHYYSRAKVHAMISWFETTGLSSLEAAASGCNLVISKKGDQEEYFRDLAFYAQPDDVDGIRVALLKAHDSKVDPALKNLIAEKYTWEKTAEATFKAYQEAVKEK